MTNSQIFVSIVVVLLVTVAALLTVAFYTLAVNKTIARMLTILGWNVTGYLAFLPLQSTVSYVSGLTFVIFTPEFKD